MQGELGHQVKPSSIQALRDTQGCVNQMRKRLQELNMNYTAFLYPLDKHGPNNLEVSK